MHVEDRIAVVTGVEVELERRSANNFIKKVRRK